MLDQTSIRIATRSLAIGVMFVLLGLVFVAVPAWAREYELRELPEAPEEIQRLLARTPVVFEIGDERPSWARSGPGGRYHLAAETKYDFQHKFASRCRWDGAQSRRRAGVLLKVTFRNVRFDLKHRIWLRRMPAAEGFWRDQLVLHELDHFRISSDPRHEREFRKLLSAIQSGGISVPGQPQLTTRIVDQLVNQKINDRFSQILELVAIRYKQLDYETSSGRRPVPAESSLTALLRPSLDQP